jgi:hypothetical protein
MASHSAEYTTYLRSPKWRATAAKAKALAGNVCARCRMKWHPVELEVHHRTYERLGRELPSDLEVLCRRTCHPIADAERAQATQARADQRRDDAAKDTYLAKRYGGRYEVFADDGMYEAAERWLSRKRYGETGQE